MSDRPVTPKERLLRALSGQKTAGTPAVPAYLCLFLADFERAFYIEQYRRRMKGCALYRIDHDEDTLFRAQALYESYGILKVRPDWIEVGQGASRAWAERMQIVAEGGVLFYEDRSTGERAPMHEVDLPWGDAQLPSLSRSQADIWDGSAQIQDVSDIDARVPVVPADELSARGDYDLPRQVVADYGDTYYISTILDTPFSQAYNLLGFQGLMLAQHDRPALLHHLLQRQLEQMQEEMGAWAATGIDGVYVEEVFTGADLISPRAYDRFVFAYNQPYFQCVRSLGLLSIHYVCGDVIPRLERIVELDIAAVAVEESKKNFRIEIEEVVDRVAGRKAIFGNVDAVRFGLHATMEEMAAETRRQIEVGARAQGFVVSTGSPFPLDTNPRLIDTMVATAHALPAQGAPHRA